jgi:NADPH-dependent ferric siderophore reductase
MSILGKVADLAADRLFRAAEVAEVVEHDPTFRTIRLVGDELRGVTWTPGQKLQVRIEGFTNRTYTPTRWDPETGETEVLAFVHGDGPGSDLLRGLAAGDACQFFGPRGSIDLTSVGPSPMLVGDETSFGLALAWANGVGGPVRHGFESQDPPAAAAVLAAVGIEGAEVVPVGALAPAVLDALDADPSGRLVLTGRAQTIKVIRAEVKRVRGSGVPTTAKAYWDENRAGLD